MARRFRGRSAKVGVDIGNFVRKVGLPQSLCVEDEMRGRCGHVILLASRPTQARGQGITLYSLGFGSEVQVPGNLICCVFSTIIRWETTMSLAPFGPPPLR